MTSTASRPPVSFMASTALRMRLVNTCCSSPSQPMTSILSLSDGAGGVHLSSIRRLPRRSPRRSRHSEISGATTTGFFSF